VVNQTGVNGLPSLQPIYQYRQFALELMLITYNNPYQATQTQLRLSYQTDDRTSYIVPAQSYSYSPLTFHSLVIMISRPITVLSLFPIPFEPLSTANLVPWSIDVSITSSQSPLEVAHSLFIVTIASSLPQAVSFGMLSGCRIASILFLLLERIFEDPIDFSFDPADTSKSCSGKLAPALPFDDSILVLA
jgi:hypothetical protein